MLLTLVAKVQHFLIQWQPPFCGCMTNCTKVGDSVLSTRFLASLEMTMFALGERLS